MKKLLSLILVMVMLFSLTALAQQEVAEASIGFGILTNGRVRKAREEGKPTVYNINDVLVSVIFDKDGKILYSWADIVEVTSPSGAGHTPVFPGWPAQGGLVDAEGKEMAVTEEDFQGAFETWISKRDMGEVYKMNSGTWTQEMDAYQKLFTGMTVQEVEDWFGKYTSDRNGRPLTEKMEEPEDASKFKALSDEEKAMLADVTIAATMSLKDSHGDMIGAYKRAYESAFR